MADDNFAWNGDTAYVPTADQQELFETIINELGRLGNLVHAETNKRRGKARTAYLTYIMGELQALRVMIETGIEAQPRRAKTPAAAPVFRQTELPLEVAIPRRYR